MKYYCSVHCKPYKQPLLCASIVDLEDRVILLLQNSFQQHCFSVNSMWLCLCACVTQKTTRKKKEESAYV